MKKTTYIIMALAAVMFAAAGCAKQTVGPEGPDCLMSIEPEVEATKAIINNAAGLQGQGFGLSIYNGTDAYKSGIGMVYDAGTWTHPSDETEWRWPSGTPYTFYAWSPAALNVGTVTNTGVPPFTYEGIASQTDIMLGYYNGTGAVISGNCAAPIKFSHALASIQFKTGTITGFGNITKIELSGVSTSGTCTPTMSGSETVNFAWSGLSSSTTTLSLEGLSVASANSGNIIGKPNDNSFLVLPQTDKPLTVTLTDNNSKTVTATIPAPALTVGKTSVYTINYDGQNVSLTVSIEGWTSGQSEAVAMGEKPVGPDPEFWVDLGMVSDNGKKLYVAKNYVKSIADNGTVTFFAPDETLQPTNVEKLREYAVRADLEDPNGYPCRVITVSEAWSFDIPNNFTKSGRIFTSNITGESASLFGSFCAEYPYFTSEDFLFDSNYALSSGNYSVLLKNHTYNSGARLVCETDEDVPVAGFKLYSYNGFTSPAGFYTCGFLYQNPFGGGPFKELTEAEIGDQLYCISRPIIVYEKGETDFYYFVSCENGDKTKLTITGPTTFSQEYGSYSLYGEGTYTFKFGDYSASIIVTNNDIQ